MKIVNNFTGRNNHVANYTIHCEGHTVQMINDKWIIDGVQMTMDEMIAKGIATKEGDSRGGKTTNIVVNGNVERIDGNINMLGVKGDVKKISTNNGDITINGNVDGDVETHYGNITCGNVVGDVSTHFGDIYRK